MKINQVKYVLWDKTELQFSARNDDVYCSGESCDEIEHALLFDSYIEATEYLQRFDEDCREDFEVLKVTISHDFSSINA